MTYHIFSISFMSVKKRGERNAYKVGKSAVGKSAHKVISFFLAMPHKPAPVS